MRIATLTVSYNNDIDKVVEWVDPFFASLSHLDSEFDEYHHYIVLNDKNPKTAGKNLKRIRQRYSIQGYVPHFIKSYNKENKNLPYSEDHGMALKKGFDSLLNVDRNSFDLILVQELDVIGYSNFFEKIVDLGEISKRFNTLVGNVLYMPDEERFSIYNFPRIHPCFLLLTPDLFPQLYNFLHHFENFQKGKISKIRKKLNSKERNIEFCNDLGSNLFHSWFKNSSFFHIKEMEFFTHLNSISLDYDKIKNGKNVKEKIEFFEEKFNTAKKDYEHEYSDESIFRKDFSEVKEKLGIFEIGA